METVPSENMGRRKGNGNHSISKNKVVKDLDEMNETDTQIQTPTKQR
jgi:hypothetical protein